MKRALARLALASTLAAPAVGQVVVIEGGRVVPVSGEPIASGTVLLRDGEIAAVGPDVPVPADAVRIDASGKWVTPGLVHAQSRLGLVEVSSVRGTADSAVSDDPIAAAFNVFEGLNPASGLIPVSRGGGVTTALAIPTGGIISGQSVVIDLAGETIEDMVVSSPAAMMLHLDEQAAGLAGGSRAELMALVRRLFAEARSWQTRPDDFQPWQRDTDATPSDLEALVPVLDGELAVFVDANRRSDIENALRLAEDHDLRLVVTGGKEAWQSAPRLAELGTAVVINPLDNIPRYDGLRARLDNGALLETAGVPVVIIEADVPNARNLRWAAGNAVANGMSWAGAFRAITLTAAEAIGVGERYGSLEPGKVANVVIWSGDPMELGTAVERVFIRGVETSTANRQNLLLNRYLGER
ncbi:MAG: amidohydrolase family protein [Acidobacteriota bacterium]|nr:amidohydrolase family protein [Acidobacteriota bacterium]